MIKAIDLFSGCGGFSCGFEMAGFDIVSAVEFDDMIAQSYIRNHKNTKMIIDDIKNVDNSNIFKKNCCDIIIGSPPCQGFSMAGARIRKNGLLEDSRNYLFKHYFNIVKIVMPKMFVMENVKGILTLSEGKIFNEIIKIFTNPQNFGGKAYKIQYKVLKATDFGIPQARERVVIIGSLIDFDFEEELNKTKDRLKQESPHFFDHFSVNDAISNLPSPNEQGMVSGLIATNPYQEFLAGDGTTFNHCPHHHTPLAIQRMSQIGIDENFTSLNEEIKSVHSGSYGRLNPNGVAPTITTRFDTPSGGKFIHPFENRTLTPREAARLQSFPDNFEFLGSKSSICKQIGNAVPPKLAYVLATMIKGVLN